MKNTKMHLVETCRKNNQHLKSPEMANVIALLEKTELPDLPEGREYGLRWIPGGYEVISHIEFWNADLDCVDFKEEEHVCNLFFNSADDHNPVGLDTDCLESENDKKRGDERRSDEAGKTKLKELRVKYGMTQAQFAQYFGIPKRSIENWESASPSSKRKCNQYLIDLMEYKLERENRLIFKYFCGDCGHRFESSIPERDNTGALNDIFCPHCGIPNIYPDTPEGAAQSAKDVMDYEDDLEQWIDDNE